MTAAHTPGPWYSGQLRDVGTIPGCDIGAMNNSNVAIALHQSGERERGESIANAQLIAAAPDLLAALEEMTIVECPECGGSGHRPYDKHNACRACAGCGEIARGAWPPHVRAAVAKAKGGA